MPGSSVNGAPPGTGFDQSTPTVRTAFTLPWPSSTNSLTVFTGSANFGDVTIGAGGYGGNGGIALPPGFCAVVLADSVGGGLAARHLAVRRLTQQLETQRPRVVCTRSAASWARAPRKIAARTSVAQLCST